MNHTAALVALLIAVIVTSGCARGGRPVVNDTDTTDNGNGDAVDTTTELFLVQVEKRCSSAVKGSLSPDDLVLDVANYQAYLLDTTRAEALAFEGDPCVIHVLTQERARQAYQTLPPEIREQVDEQIRAFRLQRTVLHEDLPEVPDFISDYQLYVTPADPAVQSMAAGLTGARDAYEESMSWVWVSEETLNGVIEKWLTPNEFLTATPAYMRNPVPGRIASDCSEQANTLASLIRATGTSQDNVRVVLGLVNFDGNVGGHAWTEYYDGTTWIPLEATSGAYYDDETGQLVESSGVPFNYFKFYAYPVVELWVTYNDFYFYDYRTGEGNAPDFWLA